MALNQTVAQTQFKVSLIQDRQQLTDNQKSHQIKQLRSSFVEEKADSFKTITSIANTMIGSSIIVYPILFIQDGIIMSAFVMLIVGIVQYWTCRILCLHNKQVQMDVNDTILRILGKRWYYANLATNVLLLYIVCVVYFILIGSNFYAISSFIIQLSNKDYHAPQPNVFTFKEYSYQWAGLLIMLVCIPTLFLQKMDLLLKFLKYTAYGVFVYMFYVFVFSMQEIIARNVQWNDYILIDKDFSNVAGAFALSFIIHPVISPILKKNAHHQNNNKDLFFGYVLTAFIYGYVGILGAFACGGVVKQIINDNQGNYQNIFDCFNHKSMPVKIISRLVELLILLQNMSVYPILSFLTRKQFLQMLYKQNPNRMMNHVFTASLIIISLLVQMFDINITSVISFDGAVVGFLMVYAIPIYMHLKCCYHEYTTQQNNKRLKDIQISYSDDSSLLESVGQEEEKQILECTKHPEKHLLRDIILYSIILIFGVAMGTFKIYSFIKS